MKSYFQGNKDHPYHFSVGAILLNDKNEVCVHHINKIDLPLKLKGYWTEQGLVDFYILMRETPSPNEGVEETLKRGLVEEFGATADIIDYIGSIKSHWSHEGVDVEKTTIYFLCKLINQDSSLRRDDIEGRTDIEWQTIDFLIPKMKEQSQRYTRTDIDESSILEKLK